MGESSPIRERGSWESSILDAIASEFGLVFGPGFEEVFDEQRVAFAARIPRIDQDRDFDEVGYPFFDRLMKRAQSLEENQIKDTLRTSCGPRCDRDRDALVPTELLTERLEADTDLVLAPEQTLESDVHSDSGKTCHAAEGNSEACQQHGAGDVRRRSVPILRDPLRLCSRRNFSSPNASRSCPSFGAIVGIVL